MRPIWVTLLMGLFLALAPAALASTTWYVNGTTGSDNNNCKSPTTACKTIGHVISLAASGDFISVAAATYTENLTIGISLTLTGASALSTIIDGGAAGTVVTISSASAHVSLSNVTLQNGFGLDGGGVYNSGTLLMNESTIRSNVAGTSCLAFCNIRGGGIYNGGTLTINNSTISENRTSSSRLCRICSANGGHLQLRDTKN